MSRRRFPADPAALLLAHGAGSDADHPSLLAIEDAVAPLPVRRLRFPYRQAGRRAPDRAPVLLEAMAREVEAFAHELGVGPERIVLGGRSMGGRIASMLVADGAAAAGLTLIAYPLHPPGKPERLRTEHLGRVRIPTLFVSGTRDPFGSPEELAAAHRLLRATVTSVWVEGGRHELRGADHAVATAVARFIGGRRPPESINPAGSAGPR